MVRATSMTHSALVRRLVRATALGAWLLPAAAIAQDLSPPTLTVPPQVLQQAPAAAVPLPVLSDKQAAALAALLARDSVAQGLTDTPMVVPQDQDGLVRAALDHARAVHSGRLAESDFQRDWAMRPVAYDPLPGFADAVARDRLAAWIATLPPPYAGLRRARRRARPLSRDRRGGRLDRGRGRPRPRLRRQRPARRRAARSASRSRIRRSPAPATASTPRCSRRSAARSGATGSTRPARSARRPSPRSTCRSRRGSARSWPTWSAGAGCRPSSSATASRSTSPPPC